jgi:hypothetical protein
VARNEDIATQTLRTTAPIFSSRVRRRGGVNLLGAHSQQRIGAQLLVVVAVLVAEAQAEDALLEQRLDGVGASPG